MGSRYQNWTSRVLIELTLGIIFKVSGIIWKFGNVAVITLMGYSITKLFVKKEMKKELSMMVLWLIILYPMERMSSAGWAATTVNYLWPLSFMLFSFISIRYAVDKRKMTIIEAILFSASLIYAGNQELCAVILFVTYLMYTIILTVRDKKQVSKFMYFQTILALLSIIFILTTPGNQARKLDETVTYMPEYYTLSVFDKLDIGVTATIGELLANSSVTFAIFSFMIMVFIWDNYKDRLVRGISAIPFTASIALSFCSGITESAFQTVKLIREDLARAERLITPRTYTYIGSYTELVLSLVVIFSIFMCLALIFKKLKNGIPLYIFGAGLVTRLILGFSPTLYISTNRTFIFLEFAMIICTLLIWQEFIKKSDKKLKTKIYNVIVWTSILQYIASLGFIFISGVGV